VFQRVLLLSGGDKLRFGRHRTETAGYTTTGGTPVGKRTRQLGHERKTKQKKKGRVGDKPDVNRKHNAIGFSGKNIFDVAAITRCSGNSFYGFSPS